MSRFPRDRHRLPIKFRPQFRRNLVDIEGLMAFSRSVDWQQFCLIAGASALSVNVWAWQWELMLATGIGAAMMTAVYRAYDLPLAKYAELIAKLWQGDNQRLVTAVGSGALGTLTSFGAIALWQSTNNHWLVVLLGCQTVMIAAILLIATREFWGSDKEQEKFEQALENLGHPSPIKRLATIRYFRQLLQQQTFSAEQQQVLYTFLHLAWREETDENLRDALLATLSLAQKFESGKAAPKPLVSPQKASEPFRFQRLPDIEWVGQSPEPQQRRVMAESFQEERI